MLTPLVEYAVSLKKRIIKIEKEYDKPYYMIQTRFCFMWFDDTIFHPELMQNFLNTFDTYEECETHLKETTAVEKRTVVSEYL